MGVWYVTRDDFKRALDFKETARNNAQIDRAIEAGSRAVETVTKRRFYPERGTKFFDYPNDSRAPSWRLWLEQHSLVSLTSLSSGGEAITGYFLEPFDDGPPYDRIEIDRATSGAFNSGDTPQRSISVTGVFGYNDETRALTLLGEALDATETAVDVQSSAYVGVGSLLTTVAAEKMIVSGQTSKATGLTLSANVAASNGTTLIPFTGSGTIYPGEVITIGSERMDVEDVLGSNLAVRRAVDGSTLAAHVTSDAIYAPRTLTVERGVLGTTAASANDSTAIRSQVYPGLVTALCIAEAENFYLSENSGYARTSGSGDNERTFSQGGLNKLREQTRSSIGRMIRKGAI